MRGVWELRAKLYDICEGSELRRGVAKSALFQNMRGRVLFVAIGTGVDILHFPPGLEIVAVDISKEMLRRAEARRAKYVGNLQLVEADAMNLGFPDASFDTVATSCTFCSVPDPMRGLMELFRVLRPGGQLLMFEHVRSRTPIFGLTLDLMTLWTRRLGTEMNRDTVGNVRKAGFKITRIDSIYLDIILAIHARKP
ncbi:MAG: methyltransferase domain-containing protein [Planctomycetes bacterium]|nr:methyltransferase domain-containing protein [Planctomycetota bacterium]